ncbi:MAG: TAXI family TRAP transporter solute-binding subunit [Pseudomonadota bacterium]
MKLRLDRLDFTWVQLFLFVVLAAAILYFVYQRALDLLPPTTMSFAAGREGSAYFDLATQYQERLAQDGIEVEIIQTAGSVENAERLGGIGADADVAFLQGGVPAVQERPVEALAAVFLEPLWIVHKGQLSDPADPTSWSGLRIAGGGFGSGTRFVIDELANVTGARTPANTLLPIGGHEATDALLSRRADAAIYVAPVTASYLTPLFGDPDVTVASIRDGAAIARRLPFIRQVDIPRSGFDYAQERPPKDIALIAMIGRLVAREDLHPALVDRLIAAARDIHSKRDLVTNENEFPSTAGISMPLNAQADDLLKKPPSPLYGFLPYWVVAQINSFALLLVPLLVIIVPLMRILPGLYEWQMRARVYRRYPELREIERDAAEAVTPAEINDLEARLEDIERDVARLRLPMKYKEYAYTMRMHIDLVRRQLADLKQANAPGGREVRSTANTG